MKRLTLAVLVALTPLLSVYGGEKKFCAAVRGNGDYILAHFGALASITESYGTLDGIAGGSSGSITAFLYESMLMNPAVSKCTTGKPGSKECEAEKARKVALLLKSAPEILEVMKKSPEALAIRDLTKLQAEIKAKGIQALFDAGKLKEAGNALKTVLQSKELTGLINPEAFKLIQNGRAGEVYQQIAEFGKFDASDPRIFFRPGFVNFKAAPYIFGKLADFFAGRGPIDSRGMNAFFDECATSQHVGVDWFSMEEKCRTSFNGLLTDYRKKYDAAPKFSHRAKDPVGGLVPTLVSTSVLEGKPTADKWRKAKEEYLASKKLNPPVDFKPGFDKVKFGYWGKKSDLEEVDKKIRNFKDMKSAKFHSLGPTDWGKAISISPAEPGLANGQEIDEKTVSLGGWSDLHPVQALKAMDCKHVIYVTRKGPESKFAVGVARQLGMTQAEEDKLFTLKSGDELSSYQEAIEMADAVYCTDWNRFPSSAPVEEMTKDAYYSPVVTKSEFFKNRLQGKDKTVASHNGEGCNARTATPPRERMREITPETHY